MSPFSGVIFFSTLSHSPFSLSPSLSLPLSLPVSSDEVGGPQPTISPRYERNQAGPEKTKVALDLGALRLLWQIRKGTLPLEEFTYCVKF